MGGNVSTQTLDEKRAEWSIPSWCLGIREATITPEVSRLVQESWSQVITTSDSEAYKAAHQLDHTLTPITFFYDRFYSHLFEWCPEVRKMFTRGIRAQGQMLANVIKFIVDNIGVNDKEFRENLTMLAKVHNGRGITANHYSVMGMTLIHTIRCCIGEKRFTEEHRQAWIVVYSRMMIVMIPVVVSGETIDSDYLVAKAQRNSQSAAASRRSITPDENAVCPANRGHRADEYSQCPNSRKSSLVGKEHHHDHVHKPSFDSRASLSTTSVSSQHSDGSSDQGRRQSLATMPSIAHSSRTTSVSVRNAVASVKLNDSDL